MTRRSEKLRDEVIAQNRRAASPEREAALDDPAVMYVVETAVGGPSRRLYELGLGRVIARLAEELARVEAELATLAPAHREEETPEPVMAGAGRRPRRPSRC